jgi:hypothetical protein
VKGKCVGKRGDEEHGGPPSRTGERGLAGEVKRARGGAQRTRLPDRYRGRRDRRVRRGERDGGREGHSSDRSRDCGGGTGGGATRDRQRRSADATSRTRRQSQTSTHRREERVVAVLARETVIGSRVMQAEEVGPRHGAVDGGAVSVVGGAHRVDCLRIPHTATRGIEGVDRTVNRVALDGGEARASEGRGGASHEEEQWDGGDREWLAGVRDKVEDRVRTAGARVSSAQSC